MAICSFAADSPFCTSLRPARSPRADDVFTMNRGGTQVVVEFLRIVKKSWSPYGVRAA